MRVAAVAVAILVPFTLVGDALTQGFPPNEAAQKMTPAAGFDVSLVAAEPLVRQPVCIEFDDRGRLWVVQYLQYPNPAGLKRVKVDRYSRTVYDRVPEPPPKGPKGADRISILEARDGSGRATTAKDFVKDLNLATGIAFGHGGVFVLQVPYLLFYPDRDGDDVPDADPQVLLKGFGMQDAHSVANSLTWGPDGWLYGCQGSTVSSEIDGIAFEQGVWRYHPITHKFELFADGGGNSWGLDFDAVGNLLYSTNFGGYVLLHAVQGGYYWKQFDKHGSFRNPFTFGYFDHAAHKDFRGGHVTVGGIVYQGDTFPAALRGKYIAADLLGHAVRWNDIQPIGSTFRTAHGGELLLANDTWFAPSDVTLGPDGAVYVADWHDKRTAHPDPDAEWDRSNGRIYRIQANGAKTAPLPDLPKLPSEKLVALLAHPNDWIVRRARRILADRRDPEVIFPLQRIVAQSKYEPLGLQALWALYGSGGFSAGFAEKLLDHPNPHIRRWTVRFLGDDRTVSPALVERLAALAAREPDVTVRSELASSARRFPAPLGLAIVEQLLRHGEDAKDPHLPLLLWWAVEHHAGPSRRQVVAQFAPAAMWKNAFAREAILGRLMRRYAAEGTEAGLLACAELLASAPGPAERQLMLASLDQGLRDRPGHAAMQAMGSLFTNYAPIRSTKDVSKELKFPPELTRQLLASWKADVTDATLLRLLVLADHEPARERVRALAVTQTTPLALRVRTVALLESASDLASLLAKTEPEEVRMVALDTLQRFDRADTVWAVLGRYSEMSPKLRSRAVDVLLSRKSWALALVQAVDAGKVPDKDVAIEQLRVTTTHGDKQLMALVRKHWGNVSAGTPEEKLAEMRRLNNDLNAGIGNPAAGKVLFKKHCAACHMLFGEGEKVGPELTGANRRDRDFLLASLVDPSAVIRREYLSHVIRTTDGRVLTGLIVEQTAGKLTLVNAKGERLGLAPAHVESLQESPVSVMPEGLLTALTPQGVRDLFSYLQGNGK
jgi:putative membrane-bound dehydrogenase-like protein